MTLDEPPEALDHSCRVMLNDLFDAFSYLWSWRWPVADGQVTAVDIERIGEGRNKIFRLAVAYEFSLGEDGPYTGESFWQPAFLAKTRVQNTARRFHLRQQVAIRYRPDDPSINRLDRSVWHKEQQ